MVTIIDPHIKKDDDYKISKQAEELDLYVKNKDGQNFIGQCWPGKHILLFGILFQLFTL